MVALRRSRNATRLTSSRARPRRPLGPSQAGETKKSESRSAIGSYWEVRVDEGRHDRLLGDLCGGRLGDLWEDLGHARRLGRRRSAGEPTHPRKADLFRVGRNSPGPRLRVQVGAETSKLRGYWALKGCSRAHAPLHSASTIATTRRRGAATNATSPF